MIRKDSSNLERHEVDRLVADNNIKTVGGLLNFIYGDFRNEYSSDYVIKLRGGGMGLEKRIEQLESALEDCRLFAEWVECLGRTDCEVYKHELKGSADRSIDRINKVLEIEPLRT